MRAAVVVFVVVIFGLLSVLEAVPAPQFYGGYPGFGGGYGGYGGYPGGYGGYGGYPGFNRGYGGGFSSAQASASASAGGFGGGGFYG